MDIDTEWRESAERTLSMEESYSLSQPAWISVYAVYVEKGAITSVVDKGKVKLEAGLLRPDNIRALELTRASAGRVATVITAAMCTCPLAHAQVAAGESANAKIVTVDISKEVVVPPVLPEFAPLLSVHVFINVRNRVRTRKMHIRRPLRASRRARSDLKQ